MALVTASGHAVFSGNLLLPRVGVWSADFALDAQVSLAGRTSIAIAEGATFAGSFVSAELAYGRLSARIVGGAGGMSKLAMPKHYSAPVVRTVLTDLARAAGETLSPTIAAPVLSARLTAWTVMRTSVGEQLALLVAYGLPAATAWRILPDGTLWLGQETWPASSIKQWRELERSPRERRLELALSSPSLLPGTVLGGERLDYIEHRIGPDGARSSVWLA